MEVRPSGKPIDTREVQPKKPQSLIEVTLLGTSTWPCASGVYRHPAAAPPSASSSKVTGRIAVLSVEDWANGFSDQSAKTMQWPNACGPASNRSFGEMGMGCLLGTYSEFLVDVETRKL